MTDAQVSLGVRSGFRVLGWIRSWWQRPILEVSAEPREPWTVRTELVGLPGVQPIDVGKRATNYYRVRVQNRGGTPARGVRVSLDAVFYVDRSVWRELQGWEPADLVWALRPDISSITLAAEEAAFCDLGHTVSNYVQNNVLPSMARRVISRDLPDGGPSGLFFLDVTRRHVAQVNCFNRGHYVLRLRVYSENAGTVTVHVELWFSGKFASIEDAIRDDSPGLAGTIVRMVTRPPSVGTVHDEQLPTDG